MTPQPYILHGGKTEPVRAQCISNGVPCLVIMPSPGHPVLIPLACAVAAPGRSVPRLIWENPNAV